MGCPLCKYGISRPGWIGSTFYGGKEFRYSQCLGCRSLYADPMPDRVTLKAMYGPEYETPKNPTAPVDDPKDPRRIIDWLRELGTGVFIDFGCGAGALLSAARQLNWEPIGVELDAVRAALVQRRTGVRVVTDPSVLLNGDSGTADVIHLGDVIEHLTELDQQMPEIVRLMKPGGLLLAQGPLEANACPFTWALRLSRCVGRWRRTEMPPYHVLLATAEGQRALFNRVGLRELQYVVTEVAWPAPSRLERGDWKRPRRAGMWALRRCSQVVSKLRPGTWGNRYFYAGRRRPIECG